MGLNELFFQHQVALMHAERSDNYEIRQKFGARADCFAAQIETLQHRLGARSAPLARVVQK